MSGMKRKLIADAQQLDVNSKIEFFNFMVSLDISYMENTNGIFFSMSDLSDDVLEKLFQKLEILKSFETKATTIEHQSSEDFYEKLNVSKPSEEETTESDEFFLNKQEDDINDENGCTDTQETNPKNTLYDHLDEEIIKDMTNRYSKQSKKNMIYAKYAIAKKKYNKCTNVESKKFDSFDLNELTKEDYIL